MSTVGEQRFAKRGGCVLGAEKMPDQPDGWAPAQQVGSSGLSIAAQGAGLVGRGLTQLREWDHLSPYFPGWLVESVRE